MLYLYHALKLTINGNFHTVGGVILKLMDECAGITAAKHCESTVVTAALDATNFLEKVKLGKKNIFMFVISIYMCVLPIKLKPFVLKSVMWNLR